MRPTILAMIDAQDMDINNACSLVVRYTITRMESSFQTFFDNQYESSANVGSSLDYLRRIGTQRNPGDDECSNFQVSFNRFQVRFNGCCGIVTITAAADCNMSTVTAPTITMHPMHAHASRHDCAKSSGSIQGCPMFSACSQSDTYMLNKSPQTNPYVVAIVPEPVDYFRACGLTSVCRSRCRAEIQAFEDANANPTRISQTFTVSGSDSILIQDTTLCHCRGAVYHAPEDGVHAPDDPIQHPPPLVPRDPGGVNLRSGECPRHVP